MTIVRVVMIQAEEANDRSTSINFRPNAIKSKFQHFPWVLSAWASHKLVTLLPRKSHYSPFTWNYFDRVPLSVHGCSPSFPTTPPVFFLLPSFTRHVFLHFLILRTLFMLSFARKKTSRFAKDTYNFLFWSEVYITRLCQAEFLSSVREEHSKGSSFVRGDARVPNPIRSRKLLQISINKAKRK